MGVKIPRLLVEFILLGPEDDRRQLQDSPILADVWVEFARQPKTRLELLITPHKEKAAAETAHALNERVRGGPEAEDRPNIAYLEGIVAASLTFEEVIRFVLPMTYWWGESRIADAMKGYLTNVNSLVMRLRGDPQGSRELASRSVRDRGAGLRDPPAVLGPHGPAAVGGGSVARSPRTRSERRRSRLERSSPACRAKKRQSFRR